MRTNSGLATLGQLKILVVSSIAGLTAVLGLLPLMGFEFAGANAIWVGLPFVIGLAGLVLAPTVGQTARPLPRDLSAADTERIVFGVLRSITMLRFAIADAPALIGLAATVIAGSALPYAIGWAFSVTLLALMVYPSDRVVSAIRIRLNPPANRSR